MALEKVKSLLAEHLSISADKINENSRIVEDLGADSLDTVELLMAFEDEFGISISDEEATQLKTVAEVVELIENKTK